WNVDDAPAAMVCGAGIAPVGSHESSMVLTLRSSVTAYSSGALPVLATMRSSVVVLSMETPVKLSLRSVLRLRPCLTPTMNGSSVAGAHSPAEASGAGQSWAVPRVSPLKTIGSMAEVHVAVRLAVVPTLGDCPAVAWGGTSTSATMSADSPGLRNFEGGAKET